MTFESPLCVSHGDKEFASKLITRVPFRKGQVIQDIKGHSFSSKQWSTLQVSLVLVAVKVDLQGGQRLSH